jgi:hypothetical protein
MTEDQKRILKIVGITVGAIAALALVILALIWLFGSSQGWKNILGLIALVIGFGCALWTLGEFGEGRIDLFRPISFIIAAILVAMSGFVLYQHVFGDIATLEELRPKGAPTKEIMFEAMVMNSIFPSVVFLCSLLLGTISEAAGQAKSGSERTKELTKKIEALESKISDLSRTTSEISDRKLSCIQETLESIDRKQGGT